MILFIGVIVLDMYLFLFEKKKNRKKKNVSIIISSDDDIVKQVTQYV